MNNPPLAIRTIALILLLLGSSRERAQSQGTAFAYQGSLNVGSAPASGNFDFTFTLFDAASDGAAVGASSVVADLAITNRQFTTLLDFGAGVFNGDARWLEISVRPGDSVGPYTTLAPRQPITPTPYAITAGNLAGVLPGTALAGTYSEGLALPNSANTFAGSFAGNGTALTSLNAANLTTGRMVDARLSTNVALLNARQTFIGTNIFISTNAGSPLTISNTTDNVAGIDFRQRFYRWRLGQNRPPDSPSTPDAFFILGDDLSFTPHTRLLIDTFGRVGIGTVAPESRLHVAGTVTATGDLVSQRLVVGETNLLTGAYSTIAGGRFNTNLASSATLAGGSNNTLQPSADNSSLGGGEVNVIMTNGHHATLGGGQSNTILGAYAIIPGGQLNQATNYGFAAGRRARAGHEGAFVWADAQDADFSSTGPNQFNVRASGGARFVTGGGGLTLDGLSVLAGVVPGSALSGTYSNALALNNAGNTFVGSFAGNGAGLTNLIGSGVPTNAALLTANQTFAGANTFTNLANSFAGSFAGNGAAVTNLNATNLSSGTVPGARLAGTYSNALTFNNAGNTFVGSFAGNGAGLTNLIVSGVPTNVALLGANQTFAGANTFTNLANAFAGNFTGNGAAVINLNATNLSSGILPGARLAGTYPNALTLNNAGNTFVGSFAGNGAGLTNLIVSGVPTNVALLGASQTFAGANMFTNAANAFAGSFTGNGAAVTSLNASNLASGTIPSARLSGTYSGALTLNNAANRFTGNGAALTSLSASNLSDGTLADARLSTNVALLNAPQTFSSTNRFTNAANTFVGAFAGNGAGLTNLNVANLSSNVALLNALQTFSGTNAFISPANTFLGSYTGNGAGLTNLNVPSVPANVALLTTNQTFTGVNTFPNAANAFVGSLTGNGAAVTNLNATNLASGTVPSARLSGTYSGALTLNNAANRFTGNGAALTSLSASNLSGTVLDARLSTNVPLLNAAQTFAGTNSFNNAANAFVGSFTGNGAGLTNLSGAALAANVALLNTNQTFTGANNFNNPANSFSGNGAALTSLNASSLGSGAVPEARLSTNVALLNAPQTFSSASIFSNAANAFVGSFTGNGAGLTNLNVPSVPANVALLTTNQNFTGVNTFPNAANAFVGSYTGNGAGVTNLNAAGLSAGTLPSARLSGTYSGALTLNNAANRFTGNGAALTSLSASNLSGTVPDARLSTNVPLLNASQTFSGTNHFSNVGNSFVGSFTGNLLRTADNAPLELKLNAAPALRLEPTASGFPNVIGGSLNNVIPGAVGATIGGGFSNTAGGLTPIVGGGSGNTANGLYATIPGGTRNAATNYAFAAGRRAQAIHDGAFVWGDATDADLMSTNANSVTIRASGGFRLFSNPAATAGVSLATNATSWGSISDRNAKKNFHPVDVRSVLERLALVPMQRWNYKWEPDGAVPHLGPTAQDFKSAFYPGREDKVITTQEIDGVALAAIQGVNQKLEEQAVALRTRDAEIQELKQTVAELKELVNALARQPISSAN